MCSFICSLSANSLRVPLGAENMETTSFRGVDRLIYQSLSDSGIYILAQELRKCVDEINK